MIFSKLMTRLDSGIFTELAKKKRGCTMRVVT